MMPCIPHKFTKDNSFFLCHRCFYISHLKNDMEKHYDRKKPCSLRHDIDSSITLTEHRKLSMSKRYFFDKPLPDVIPPSTCIKLIKEFHQDINYIDLAPVVLKDAPKAPTIITDNGVDDDDEDIILTATIDHIKICDNSLKEQQLLPGLSNLKPKPTFQCDVCEKVFKKKDSYIHHVVNGSALCKKTCLFNMSLKKQQEKIE